MRSAPAFTAACLLALFAPPQAEAQATSPTRAPADTVERTDTLTVFDLEPLTVTGRLEDLIGRASTASEGYVGAADLARRPIAREGELLETVPGMILTQHSGSGKSNQMFVRGFNLDHGTDFSTRVDGMPVNIPTHAHGQGYTDLNFLVPELVDNVEYSLGNYYAEIGDFGSAGGAHVHLLRTLDRPLFVLGAGENGHRRVVAAASSRIGGRGSLLAGVESRSYDGPWEVPEALDKVSGMARFSLEGAATRFSVLALAYDNAWQSSDQIPSRAVADGRISRFGQIDETLGGESSRYSLSATWNRTGDRSSQRIEAYGVRYSLDLFSNFTYRLDDAEAGDQFRQQDDGRTTLGLRAAHQQALALGARDHRLTVGVEARRDRADVTLSRTRDRQTVGIIRSDDVRQSSAGVHTELVSPWSDRWTTTLGLRADLYHFDVESDLAANTGTATDGIVSPKASIAYRIGDDAELYLAGGLGFHSNDARGTVTTIDPASGDAAEPVDPLVRSRGAEVGLRVHPLEGVRTTATLWTVDTDSELLFVGDAGTTEASDGSRRVGLTLANFWRIDPEWSADVDLSLTRARFLEVDSGVDRVPGALENVLAAGVSRDPVDDGVFGSVRLRRFGSYPLVEDNAVRADAASLVNAQLGYRIGDLRLGVAVFNLFDEAHSDIQYFYASRLQGEPAAGVEDVHFHPTEPRSLQIQLSWGH